MAGDDTLFITHTLGGAQCVRSLVAKVRQAWGCEALQAGTLHVKPTYGLSDFIPLKSIDAAIEEWVAGGWRRRNLILSGGGGLGKNELRCAVAQAAYPANALHF